MRRRGQTKRLTASLVVRARIKTARGKRHVLSVERARSALTSYLELAAVHNAVPSRAGEAVRIPSDAVKRDTLGQAALEGVCKAADCESVRRANNL